MSFNDSSEKYSHVKFSSAFLPREFDLSTKNANHFFMRCSKNEFWLLFIFSRRALGSHGCCVHLHRVRTIEYDWMSQKGDISFHWNFHSLNQKLVNVMPHLPNDYALNISNINYSSKLVRHFAFGRWCLQIIILWTGLSVFSTSHSPISMNGNFNERGMCWQKMLLGAKVATNFGSNRPWGLSTEIYSWYCVTQSQSRWARQQDWKFVILKDLSNCNCEFFLRCKEKIGADFPSSTSSNRTTTISTAATTTAKATATTAPTPPPPTTTASTASMAATTGKNFHICSSHPFFFFLQVFLIAIEKIRKETRVGAVAVVVVVIFRSKASQLHKMAAVWRFDFCFVA